MKKTILILLSLCLIFSFSGCFGGEGGEDKSGIDFEYEIIDFVRLKNFSPNEESNILITTSVIEYNNFLEYMSFYVADEKEKSVPIESLIDPEENKYTAEFFSDHDLVFIYTEDDRPVINTVTDVKYLSDKGEISIDLAKAVPQKTGGAEYSLILVSVPKTGFSSSGFNVTKFVQITSDAKKTLYTNVAVITRITDGAIFAVSQYADGSTENFVFAARQDENIEVGDRVITAYDKVYSDGKSHVFCDPYYFEKYASELNDDIAFDSFLYLYPDKDNTVVTLSANIDGVMPKSEPAYDNGWTVSAYSDGHIVDSKGTEKKNISWRGFLNKEIDLSSGYCVKGSDTEAFFADKAAELGLNENETSDFVKYWTDRLSQNRYNFIRFYVDPFSTDVKYEISQTPQTSIRVFVFVIPSESFINTEPQQFSALPERAGFTVVDWGGAVLPSGEKSADR